MSHDPLVAKAAQLDSRVKALTRDPFGALPTFEFDFQSEANPGMNGKVVLRYPNLGDMLEIEALSVRGRTYSEVLATLQTLIEKAPEAWYTLPEGASKGVLALSRLPWDPQVFALYNQFSAWRDSFRRGPVAEPAPPAE